MIENINNNRINGMQPNKPENNPRSAPKTSGKKSVDMNITADNKALEQKAIQAAETNDTEKIQKAQKMLASGEIDNIENIKKAAENIIKYGI
jgi:hypothetical protein